MLLDDRNSANALASTRYSDTTETPLGNLTDIYLGTQAPILQDIFGHSREQISTRLITIGNDVAHQFSLAEATAAISENEEPLRDYFLLFGRYGKDVQIRDAVKRLEQDLANKHKMTLAEW